jgi:two-component system sensor histidine kinase DesK
MFTISRNGPPLLASVLLVLAAVALGALQLRHGLAASRSELPAGWAVSLAAVVLLAYVPTWWFTWDWGNTQWFVLASVALLLRGRVVTTIVVGVVVGNAALFVWAPPVWAADAVPVKVVTLTLYWVVIVVMGSLALYGSARLVRVVEELHAARLELAELAVGRERLRVSRDLHDVLGQSLSAVSLKGDLALRLLRRDPAAARAEVVEMTSLARDALRDMRAVTLGRLTVSLGTEIDAATALLRAAGIETRIEIEAELTSPASAGGDVLAWAVREGTTNLLRHSDAQRCWIRAARREGVVTLEILNDGVLGPEGGGGAGDGRGLSGLAERAEASAGSVTAGRQPDGRFRLVVEVPEAEAGTEIGVEEHP